MSKNNQRIIAVLLLGAAGLVVGCPMPPIGPIVPEPPPPVPNLLGRVITFGMPPDNLPYGRINPTTSEVSGLDFDLITALAERLNFRPRFVAAAPQDVESDLEAGEFDVATGGIAFTLDRAAEYDVTESYALAKVRIVVSASAAPADTLAAFHDAALLRAGAQQDTWRLDQAREYLGPLRVQEFESTSAAVDALVSGQIDGVAMDDAQFETESARVLPRIEKLPGPLAGALLVYLLPRDSDLTEAFSIALQSMRADGTLAAVRANWGL